MPVKQLPGRVQSLTASLIASLCRGGQGRVHDQVALAIGTDHENLLSDGAEAVLAVEGDGARAALPDTQPEPAGMLLSSDGESLLGQVRCDAMAVPTLIQVEALVGFIPGRAEGLRGGVLADTYWIVETATPSGHDIADPQAVTITAGDNLQTFTFTNDRQPASVLPWQYSSRPESPGTTSWIN